uniref:Ribosomal protein S8 n=1 Tax=Coscinodiscus granii TaxID=265552 RepID=A0A8A6W382_9STRA|nr:ribosomal protein S8 [Coscinodiscus granii]QTK21660.1 ribosomal protein S8 [Coscinodiscus granii]
MNNLFSIIQNSQNSFKWFVFIKNTKKNRLILNSLWSENLISGYLKKNSILKVFLKYYKKIPVIKKIKTFNKSNKSFFLNLKQIWKIKVNLSIPFFSTNKGLNSLNSCKKKKIGGKLLFIIF